MIEKIRCSCCRQMLVMLEMLARRFRIVDGIELHHVGRSKRGPRLLAFGVCLLVAAVVRGVSILRRSPLPGDLLVVSLIEVALALSRRSQRSSQIKSWLSLRAAQLHFFTCCIWLFKVRGLGSSGRQQ